MVGGCAFHVLFSAVYLNRPKIPKRKEKAEIHVSSKERDGDVDLKKTLINPDLLGTEPRFTQQVGEP